MPYAGSLCWLPVTGRQRRPPARGLHGEVFGRIGLGIRWRSVPNATLSVGLSSDFTTNFSKKPPRVSPQGVALIGVNLSRPRPPARGGPTLDERVVGLVEPPRIVGPPLAGGLRRARTGLS